MTHISPENINKIKDSIKIIEVIGAFVVLKDKGKNHLGLCPFHNEKTPSFNVSPSKGIYKCFGCGQSGDAITFVMKHKNLSYPETMLYLANLYNVIL